MRTLYIDTSSNFLYTGIVENDELVIELQEKLEHNLSRDALPEIASMFTKTRLKPTDIDKIIVVDGPGSFTGIRIGITIAKVYAHSLKTKITTISSLEAMATSYDKASYYVPLIDARRGFVYAAIYDKEGKEYLFPQHIKLNLLKEKLTTLEDYLIITNDEIKLEGIKVTYRPNILKIVNTYKNKKSINPHSINPNYLKLTEAEESLISNDRKFNEG